MLYKNNLYRCVLNYDHTFYVVAQVCGQALAYSKECIDVSSDTQ